TLVCCVTFRNHHFHDLPFSYAWNDPGNICINHRLIVLILKEDFRSGSIPFVNLSDLELTGYRVPEKHRLPETKMHLRCQPPDLPYDLGQHAADQKSVTNSGSKILRFRKTIVIMHRIVVLADLPEQDRVAFAKCA